MISKSELFLPLDLLVFAWPGCVRTDIQAKSALQIRQFSLMSSFQTILQRCARYPQTGSHIGTGNPEQN